MFIICSYNRKERRGVNGGLGDILSRSPSASMCKLDTAHLPFLKWMDHSGAAMTSQIVARPTGHSRRASRSPLAINRRVRIVISRDNFYQSCRVSGLFARASWLKSMPSTDIYSNSCEWMLLSPWRGWPISVTVLVTLERDRTAILDSFRQSLLGCPQVTAAHYVTGEYDYVMRIFARSMQDFEQLSRALFVDNSHVKTFKTLVTMQAVKDRSPLPRA
jgi:DNA-binding Lrp family transcriptional regulator